MPPLTTSLGELTRLLGWVHAKGGTLEEVSALHAGLLAVEQRLQIVFVGTGSRVQIYPIREALALLDAVIKSRVARLAAQNYKIGQAKEQLEVMVRILSREVATSATELALLLAQRSAQLEELAKPALGRDRNFFVSELETLKVPLLRALWSLTVKPQEEMPFPKTKAEAIQDLANYYIEWHRGDPDVLAENIADAREFGADRTTLRQIKMQREE